MFCPAFGVLVLLYSFDPGEDDFDYGVDLHRHQPVCLAEKKDSIWRAFFHVADELSHPVRGGLYVDGEFGSHQVVFFFDGGMKNADKQIRRL